MKEKIITILCWVLHPLLMWELRRYEYIRKGIVERKDKKDK